MAVDVITKPKPSGTFNVSATILNPGIPAYQTLLDYTLSNAIENDIFLKLNNRVDDKNYYPPRGW